MTDPVPTATLKTTGFANFAEFYPFYLSQHANNISRRLHVFGTLAAMPQLLAALLLRNGWCALSALVSVYTLAWIGHFFFEQNRPATFRHPFYSFRGDLHMARDVLTGRIRW